MNAISNPVEFGWQYLRGTSQEMALSAPAHHILYHGARGPGKTDTQLMRFRRLVGRGYGSFWRGIIFDKEYKQLDDLITKSRRWFREFDDGAQFLESTSQLKWKWPTGEELLFRQADNIKDYYNYHGHEYPFIGWNELTKYSDEKLYEKMSSTNRSSFTPERDTPKRMGHNGGPPLDEDTPYATPDGKPLPPIPLEVFSTCNPHGPGHAWVKRKFIDVAPDCTIVRTTTTVFNPKTKKEEAVTKKQVAIHGHWSENPYLDTQYIATLQGLTDPDERKAWLDGDWDINAGGALADVWRKQHHIIERFPIPAGWRVFRSFDWGSTHPFSVGWWTEANGEEVNYYDQRGDVKTICPIKGTLIRFFEWYGTEDGKATGTNKGTKLSAADIAKGIVEREKLFRDGGWIVGKVQAGPADNQIRSVVESDTDTIEKKMADNGVTWTPSDKSAGSRKVGLQLLRDRLEATTRQEGPGIQFMDCCRASIAILPGLPRDPKDPDDVQKTGIEDHPYDEIRYVCLSAGDRTAKVIKVKFGT